MTGLTAHPEIEAAARAVASLGTMSYADALGSISAFVQQFTAVNFGADVDVQDLKLRVADDATISVSLPATMTGPMHAVPIRRRSRKRTQFLKEVGRLAK